MHNFKELKIWKLGMEVAKFVFQLTRNFPQEERYSLISQLTRCAISIPSNIAEGCGRKTNKDFNHFLTISLGSAFELETQIILAHEFNYISESDFTSIITQITELQKMINALQRTLST